MQRLRRTATLALHWAVFPPDGAGRESGRWARERPQPKPQPTDNGEAVTSGRLLLTFASELVVFVVAAGGAALSLADRAARRPERLVLAAALLALATASFLRGAEITRPGAPGLAGVRGAAF